MALEGVGLFAISFYGAGGHGHPHHKKDAASIPYANAHSINKFHWMVLSIAPGFNPGRAIMPPLIAAANTQYCRQNLTRTPKK